MVNFLTNNHHFQVLKLNNNGLGVTGGTIVANALIKAADKLKEEGKGSSLRTVICGRNRLENGSAPLWAEAFKRHGGLEEVRMFQNGIRMEGIQAISRGLSHCKGLKVLDLQDNTATLKGSRAIAAALPSWPALTTLNLSDTLLKPRGGALVLETLASGHNPLLETLQLQYNDLDRKALGILGSAISRHLVNLTKLEINGNWADEDDECIETIKSALESHGHEEALDELDEMDPEGEQESDEESDADESDQDDDADVSAQLPSVVVGGSSSGATAKSVASTMPPNEPVSAVSPSASTSQPKRNATESVSDHLVAEAETDDRATAQVAAEVSASAQAVPEESERLDTTADVAETARAIHKEDEQQQQRGQGQDVDSLANQLAGVGIDGRKKEP